MRGQRAEEPEMKTHPLRGMSRLLPLLLVAGCAGTTNVPYNPTPDARLDGTIQFGDGAPDTSGGEGLVADTGPGPDLPPGACQAKTSDGIALNPGCDPDVQANGITAVDIVTLSGATTWRVIAGKKWWSYDVTSAAFTDGGKEIATFLKTLLPDCSGKTTDGIALNPGCDPDVQVNGLSAMGSMTSGSNTVWFMTSGKKWWTFDLSKSAFTSGSGDVAAFFRTFKP